MLTNILLICIMLSGALYGWFLMFRIDRFTVEEHQLKEFSPSEEEKRPLAVIFGERNRTKEAGSWFEKKGLEVAYIEEICLCKEWENVQWVVALSEEDTDNLSVCSLFRKMYYSVNVCSICNEKVNESVFRRFGIRVLKQDEELPEQLNAVLTGKEVYIA